MPECLYSDPAPDYSCILSASPSPRQQNVADVGGRNGDIGMADTMNGAYVVPLCGRLFDDRGLADPYGYRSGEYAHHLFASGEAVRGATALADWSSARATPLNSIGVRTAWARATATVPTVLSFGSQAGRPAAPVGGPDARSV